MTEDQPPESSEGYTLEPEPELPAHPPPIIPGLLRSGAVHATPPPPDLSTEDVPCLLCGYNLRGLRREGRCPECGTSIERSLHGNLLEYSNPHYLATLHRGLFLILAAIVGQLVLVGLWIVVAFFASASRATANPNVALVVSETAASVLSIVLSLVLLYGWWLLSAPDPAFLGVGEGTLARRIVRITVIAAALLTPISGALDAQFVSASIQSWFVFGSIVMVVELVVAAVKFFASMLYIRWLAPRLPNTYVDERAKTFMWLIPVLWTVGTLACGLGPLVALVLYWIMLNWVRLDIKRIRDRHQHVIITTSNSR